MITENQALEIAKVANCLTIPKSNGVEVLPPNFTRALNLAAAMAFIKMAKYYRDETSVLSVADLLQEANEYHQAAKGETK